MNIKTEYVHPAIPLRCNDWRAVDSDTYDGAPDSSISPITDVRDVDLANANLISAAPDMRDALQEFLDYSEGGCNPNLEDVYRAKARAALAKAKGSA